VTFAGRGPTLRQQASVLLFDTTAGAPPLAIGSSVRVSVPIAAAQRAIVVPASAVVRTGSGIGVIWEQAQPERFLPRRVTLAPAGPDRIVLTAGAQAGMVVVTSGAALIHHTP
jgi:multidrug efflux pump subunit AcrA (membrane-fusion protein)